MGKQYKSLKPQDIEFIQKQKLFYLASCSDKEVNLSPKGYDTIRVIDPNKLVYASYPGSGNRTHRDAVNDGAFTLVFNAFEGGALIVRIFCKANVITKEDSKYNEYLNLFNINEGLIRNIFEFNIYAVESSCGMSVPIMEYKSERNELKDWAKDMDKRDKLEAYKTKNFNPVNLSTIIKRSKNTTHKELENGFKYIEIKNTHAEAKIALQGAHIFHYQAHNKKPLLWLSDLAYFEKGKAIRGGVPICFPWFGPHRYDQTLPQHGFARNQNWKLLSEDDLEDGSTQLQLQLTHNDETKALWEYNFLLIFNITIGKELTMQLTTINCDSEAFDITQALHSYFNVSNITNVSVEGLEKSIYYNSLDKGLEKQHTAISIEEEIDRIYLDSSPKITLVDKEQKIELDQEGSNSLVVWNPWKEKAKAMADIQDNGYKTMLCLETANAMKDFILLAPNESHTLKVTISQKT